MILAVVDPWILTFSLVTVLATIAMGFWSAGKSKTAGDFFVAGRSVSVGWNASAISGEYLSAGQNREESGVRTSSTTAIVPSIKPNSNFVSQMMMPRFNA